MLLCFFDYYSAKKLNHLQEKNKTRRWNDTFPKFRRFWSAHSH